MVMTKKLSGRGRRSRCVLSGTEKSLGHGSAELAGGRRAQAHRWIGPIADRPDGPSTSKDAAARRGSFCGGQLGGPNGASRHDH